MPEEDAISPKLDTPVETEPSPVADPLAALSSPDIPAEESTPMLDVHPAHHAASTWKEFFIHIATIVMGLLIAVGLEQMVEHLHQARELAETRQALREEREANRKIAERRYDDWRLGVAAAHNNEMVLEYAKTHPLAPPESYPGVLIWQYSRFQFKRAAWESAQLTVVISLMPREEAESDRDLYSYFDHIEASIQAMNENKKEARQGRPLNDIPRYSPGELDRVILGVSKMKEQCQDMGLWLTELRRDYPDFKMGDRAIVSDLALGRMGDEERRRVSAPTKLTMRRLSEVNAGEVAAGRFDARATGPTEIR